ncbi:MAG: N-acetylmuramoyl-L-alanine amidase [Saprospiraceae bacterium]|nr:N-acetylmuramoyl-L-alanine amidase [Saprospiraceae bacterium]
MNKYIKLAVILLFFCIEMNAQRVVVSKTFFLEKEASLSLSDVFEKDRLSAAGEQAFSFSVKTNGISKQSFTSLLKTAKGDISMDPGCDVNLEKFDYVSRLFFLSKEDLLSSELIITAISGNPSEITISLHASGFFTDKNLRDNMVVTNPVTCECPLPSYIPRTVWGNSFGLTEDIYVPPAVLTEVTHLIVHHSASSNQSNDWPAVVASFFDYHVNTNGWQDIGYNWLIDPLGNLYKGRGGGEDVRGAHMCGYNNNTMGICVIGTFTSVMPAQEALATLEQLLSYKACQKSFDVQGRADIVSHPGNMFRISGHRDGCAPNYTECPGTQLHAFLPIMREGCSSYILDSCSIVNTEDNVDDKDLDILLLRSGNGCIVKSSVRGQLYFYAADGRLLQQNEVSEGDNFIYCDIPSGVIISSFVTGKGVRNKKWHFHSF